MNDLGDGKALAATTLVGGIGVIKLKGPVQTIGNEINLGALQIWQAILINNNLDVFIYKQLVTAI